jgi:protein TonB
MAINNVDIYGDEWIELVFKDRNKSYGAYELRKHYTSTVLKALALTFGTMTGVAYLAFLLFKPAPIAAQPLKHEVTAVIQPIAIASAEDIKPTHHKHHHTTNGHSYAEAPQVVVARHPATPATPVTAPAIQTPRAGAEQPAKPITVVEDKNVYPNKAADIKPLPVGGAQGWMSYLQKNLIYPEDARHQHISGKVQLSFIVEKDGSISDITVEQSAGHGFDEEAIRVLQQSPVWQPGIKDGQPIRIRYRLPVNFQMVK